MRHMMAALAALWLCWGALAQDLSGLARVDPGASRLWDGPEGIALDLALSQPVPWRVRLMDQPPRLVVDFREVDFAGLDQGALAAGAAVADLRAGPLRPGWSRLVLELAGPQIVRSAEMRTAAGGGALLRLRLAAADAGAFAAAASLPDPDAWRLPRPADLPEGRRRARGHGPVVVVLDPGHGGIDPGAERGGLTEAALMLTFALELKEALLRAGGFRVVLTRDADVFVPLEARIAIAHAAEADVFLSLHADAIAEGVATGATIYTLSDEASDAASAALAERHERDSLMAGVDLRGQDDLIAAVLMDLARTETTPRTEALAARLVSAIRDGGLVLHRVPRRSAAFSVLKAPDIPSVLVELGYLSSEADRRRLVDPEWRARMAQALVAGLAAWAAEDAASAGLLRQ
ncbi:MAG: N-acetylmuramoyl-L-alanine amidase [Gemmobacter sp.]